ncbi:hypothetical protein Bpla01_06680 [Burkholderia plantarii]|nr:hypothetical protein Bpla01_06680 [Burkholderia plantarii]
MFSAPTTTSPALPAMPDRNERAPPSLGALDWAFWGETFDPDCVENTTFWLKLPASSANAPGAAAIRTPKNNPATARLQT